MADPTYRIEILVQNVTYSEVGSLLADFVTDRGRDGRDEIIVSRLAVGADEFETIHHQEPRAPRTE